jgi:hypothetical protein
LGKEIGFTSVARLWSADALVAVNGAKSKATIERATPIRVRPPELIIRRLLLPGYPIGLVQTMFSLLPGPPWDW